MTYLLDTNIYIQSWILWYCNNIFPGYWEWLLKEHQSGRFQMIDRIWHELESQSTIVQWKKNIDPISTYNEADIEALQEVLRTARSQRIRGNSYTFDAIKDFENCADSHLIASAYANHAVIVTEETYNGESNRRIKIPNICKDLNIRTMNARQLLQEIHPEFIWIAEAPQQRIKDSD